MRWQVFGEVSAFGSDLGPRLGTRSRAVLAMLLLNAGATTRPESLADGLWGDNRPKTARNSVQRFVADIRRRLGPEAGRLATTSDGYMLTVLDGEFDLHRARNTLARGRSLLAADSAEDALAAFDRGVEETRGVPLGGVGTAVMYATAVVPLEELVAALTLSQFEAALALGRHSAVGDQVAEYAANNPHSEQAWALHMLSLYRSGRQQKALDAGELLRKRLLDDLGVTPSPPIAKLTHQILNHADELQLTDLRPAKRASFGPRDFDRTIPVQLLRPLQTPMAGRIAALGRANDALLEVEAGLPRVTFVSGEPGIGKTRLAAEMGSRMVDRGGAVLYGRSDEDTSLPLGAWAEALGQAMATQGTDITDALPATACDALSAILPDLNPSAAPSNLVDLAAQVEVELRRSVLFQAVVHTLDNLAAKAPVLVVLDDLHWADTATVQLVGHVARHANNAVWIVAAFRDNELEGHSALSALVGSLLPEPHVQQESLAGIADTAIAELVQSLLPEVNEARLPDFARALHAETAGNPFYATEIVRHQIEVDPEQLTQNLSPTSAAPATLPVSVRHVVRQRVLRLGKTASRVLHHASIFGRTFDLGELAVIVGDKPGTISRAVEAAVHAGLLADGRDHLDRVAFAHDLVHYSLHQDVELRARRRLHGAAADAIAANTRTMLDVNDRALEVAGHLLEAREPHRARQTIDAIERAAHVSNERHAPAEAAELHARGIALAAEPAFQRELDDADLIRLRMIVSRGIELRNAGDPDYREALLDAGEQARQLGDTEAEIRAALANTRGVQTHIWEIDTERVEQLRHAVAALGDEESARRSDLLASLASELWGDDDRHEAARLRLESISLARRIGDHEALANALSRAARARNADIPNAEFRDLADELSQLLDHGDGFDPYLLVKVLRAVQNQALRDADAERLMAVGASIRSLTETTQLPVCHRSNVLSEVLIAGIRGEGERYLQLAEEALAVSIEIGDPESFIAYEGHYLVGMDMLGRAKEVLPLIAQVASERPADVYQAVTAAGHAKCGDIPAAHAVLDAALTRGFPPGVDDYTIQALQLWADAAGLTDHFLASQAIYPMLAPYSGRLSGHVVLCIQPVDLSLGRLARVLGQPNQSLSHFDVSDRICNDFEAKWMQGMTDVSRARTLVDLGQVETARGYLTRAVTRARDHHHPGIKADASALLTEINERTDQPAPPHSSET